MLMNRIFLALKCIQIQIEAINVYFSNDKNSLKVNPKYAIYVFYTLDVFAHNIAIKRYKDMAIKKIILSNGFQ